jgi:hypothetical protein
MSAVRPLSGAKRTLSKPPARRLNPKTGAPVPPVLPAVPSYRENASRPTGRGFGPHVLPVPPFSALRGRRRREQRSGGGQRRRHTPLARPTWPGQGERGGTGPAQVSRTLVGRGSAASGGVPSGGENGREHGAGTPGPPASRLPEPNAARSSPCVLPSAPYFTPPVGRVLLVSDARLFFGNSSTHIRAHEA